MENAIITVTGQDKLGIIAKVCTYLSNTGINILEISQTITSGIFNMIIIGDMKRSIKNFSEVQSEMAELGNTLGLTINVQREGIFTAMHRI